MTSSRRRTTLVVIAAVLLQLLAIPPTTAAACDRPDDADFPELQPGESWRSPDGCGKCECDRDTLHVYCISSSCAPQPCHDRAKTPGVCCTHCPNGFNCKTPRGTLVKEGHWVIEEDSNTWDSWDSKDYKNCSCGYDDLWVNGWGRDGPQTTCVTPQGCITPNGTVAVDFTPDHIDRLDSCTMCRCLYSYRLYCYNHCLGRWITYRGNGNLIG